MKAKRVYATLAIFLSLIAAFFFLPLPVSKVRETGLVSVNPDHAGHAVLAEPAVLTALEVEEGQTVRQGQVLARFDSPTLQQELHAARAKEQEYRTVARDLEQRLRERDLSPAAETSLRTELAANSSKAEEAAAKANQLQRQLNDLREVRAPRDGAVMGLPRRNEIGKMFDRTFTDARPVCTVGDPSRLIVKVPVSSNDYRLLKEDLATSAGALPVSIYVKGRTDREFEGVVRRLPESDAKHVPLTLTQRGGGPLAVKPAGEGGQETQPIAQTYLVEVELLDPDGSVRPGALVKVKIHCQWRTAAWWVGRALATAMDIGLY
jgi:putative peptide zinc metalloprotease protein